MTLTQLEAFLAAARLQTFTAAAAELGMTQPAMSDLIRRLENELDTRLFQRSNRRLSLTPAGEQLLPHAHQAVKSAVHGARAVRTLSALDGGTATFGLLRNADYYLGNDFTASFRRLHPAVRLRLLGQNSAETGIDVREGRLEAGLIALPIDDEGLDIVPLAQDELLYVSMNPDRVSRPVSIDQLTSAELILYDAHYGNSDPARRQLENRARLRGLSLEPEIEVEYLSTALSLVADGFGDTIAAKAALSRQANASKFFTARFEDPMYDTLALIKRRGEFLSSATRELARLACAALTDRQGRPRGTAELLQTADAVADFLA